jgi:hypothetical protein
MIDYVKSGAITLSTSRTLAKAATTAGPKARGGVQDTVFPPIETRPLEIFSEPPPFQEYSISIAMPAANRKIILKSRRSAPPDRKTCSTNAAPTPVPRVHLGQGLHALDSTGGHSGTVRLRCALGYYLTSYEPALA